MSNIERYNGSSMLTPRESRRHGRNLTGLELRTDMRLARIDADTDVTIGGIRAVTVATGAGMQGIMAVGQAQKSIEQSAPELSGRLAVLADSHALIVAGALHDLQHAIRRH